MNLDELLQQDEKAVRQKVDHLRKEIAWHREEADRYEANLVEQRKLHEELVTLLIDRDITPLPE